eukprot:TRINITY_DN2252_c0_g1_i1.p1 TRINITY_DN2252_c0_g1~~TRINITY_DN2252_c0_g1_i1.p1  ORF type:complete len:613 (-),score=203.67 TRINITY_DN2252_c0_g1_i1:257-2095(-)
MSEDHEDYEDRDDNNAAFTDSGESAKRSNCSTCGSSEREVFHGNLTCLGCGKVLEEGTMVSDVQFVVSNSGAKSVAGSFVSSESGKYTNSLNPSSGSSNASREMTVMNARRKISELSSGLQMRNETIAAAERIHMLCLARNFTRGRRLDFVLASCLYAAARMDKLPHLLIDFSDILKIDVFELGKTFLSLCNSLGLELPIVDPSLYIPRFAAKLDFEDKKQLVINTAIRIVSRLKRDWIQTGRRPSGICGAGLHISAKIHGFHRSLKEIMDIVRLSSATLQKRLFEFSKTKSSELTAGDLESFEEQESNDYPPCFKHDEDIKKKLLKRRMKNRNLVLREKEEHESQRMLEFGSSSSSSSSTQSGAKRKADGATLRKGKKARTDSTQDAGLESIDLENLDYMDDFDLVGNTFGMGTLASIREQMEEIMPKFSRLVKDEEPEEDPFDFSFSKIKSEASQEIKQQSQIIKPEANDHLNPIKQQSQLSQIVKSEDSNDDSAGLEESGAGDDDQEENFDDICDEEIDMYTVTDPMELKLRTEIWDKSNPNYEADLQEKASKEAENKTKRRKPRNTPKKECESAAEAALEVLKKRVSSKINYGAIPLLLSHQPQNQYQ